jgi:hypothetical protein
MALYTRKMNMYSQMRIASVLVVSLLLLGSTVTASWMIDVKANESLNSPPYEPSDPIPVNGSINVSITTNLSWTGGDPDNDTVTYTVFFGNTTSPAMVSENQSNTSYTPSTIDYNTTYYWQILAWDNHSASTAGPLWEFTTEVFTNSPPTTPNTPSPTNGSTGISLTPTLSWKGGDPDNDTVLYDVYFGNTSSPGLVSMKQPGTTYEPSTLVYNTTYYWKIVAWDSHNASTEGPLWHFTTLLPPTIGVYISSPEENHLYVQDVKRMELNNRTIIYGPITIVANVTGTAEVDRVEFYIDGNLKSTDNATPFTFLWKPLISFNGLSLKHTIKVIAYDTANNSASAELNVTKWRFHPLPFLFAAALAASTLVPHTNVQALVINLKETGLGATFFAIRLHYKTIGPFKTLKGTIHFKSCSVKVLIGPISMLKLGPFHAVTRISFTCLGSVQYGKTGTTPAGLLHGLLQMKNK